MPYTYDYPRPAVTVDVVVFRHHPVDQRLQVLLIERGEAPFEGRLALPGGHVEEHESLEKAARRELGEEVGEAIAGAVRLEQIGAFGDPHRDPRGHYVTVAYVAVLSADREPVAGDDARAAGWHDVWVDAAVRRGLAFDHDNILAMAVAEL